MDRRMVALLTIQAGVLILSILATASILQLARTHRFLALPVARSAHVRPTPVGGGLSIVLLFFAIIALAWQRGLLSFFELMALSGSLVIAVTGLLDDIRQLSIFWRLLTQCLAAGWSVFWLGPVPAVDFWVATLSNTWLLTGLMALGLLWLLNLYNFMDGIDGLAGAELVFVALVSSIFAITSGDQLIGLLSMTLASSAAGFLVWNWPPAKIFMGDVGSSFVGFSLGLLALISVQHGTISLWTWVILLAVFIVDATTTLARRFLSKQRWYEGHASHAYQHAARRYKSHAKVTITVVLINCLWLAPLAWFSEHKPELGPPLAILAMTPLLFLAIKLNAGAIIEGS